MRERGLLKFVFGRPPAEIRQNLLQFRKDMEKAIALPATLNVYDTQFHSKQDGSLDFSSTRYYLYFYSKFVLIICYNEL